MVLGIENILGNDSELANFELEFNSQDNWSWIESVDTYIHSLFDNAGYRMRNLD